MRATLICLLLFVHQCVFAQGMSENGLLIFEWMDKKKIEFQNASNDSIFITQNSDSPFRKIFLNRGDQPEDAEETIFKAKHGQVVGPFNAGTHHYLFKIVKLDSVRSRWNVNHIFIKPKGFNPEDTAASYTLGLRLAKDLNKGADFTEVLKNSGDDFKKYADKVKMGKNPGSEGASGWMWEGTTLSAFDKVLAKSRKGESVVAISPVGVHVFQVAEKQQGPYKAIVYAVVKEVDKK